MSNVVPIKPESAHLPPKRRPYADVRKREYLLPEEVAAIVKVAGRTGRYADRDQLLVIMAYRHALRVSELVNLRWDDVDLSRHTVYVKRLKGSTDSTQYLERDELVLMRKLKPANGGFIFRSERGGTLARGAVHKIVSRAGQLAGLPFPIHAHMLRHAKGYQLANSGTHMRLIQGYMGHKNIQNTVRYTDLDVRKYKGLGADDLR